MIRLQHGENFAAFSPLFKKKVMAILNTEFDNLCLYSDIYKKEFLGTAAQLHEVSEKNIVAGHGIEGLLSLFMQTFLKAGDIITILEPSFFYYDLLAKELDLKVNKVKLKAGKLDIDQLMSTHEDMMILASVNNPIGNQLVDDKLLLQLSKKSCLILLDQCYEKLINDNLKCSISDNLVQLKSFSKSYGLAGIKLGYAIGNENLISSVKKKQELVEPYNLSSISYIIGKLALEHDNAKTKHFLELKSEFIQQLEKIDELSIEPCHLTFVKLKLPISAKKFSQEMKTKGIFVKDMDIYELDKNITLLGIPKSKDQPYVVNSIKRILSKKEKL